MVSGLEIRGQRGNTWRLAALPSNRLEALRGSRAGQGRIRINVQWRI